MASWGSDSDSDTDENPGNELIWPQDKLHDHVKGVIYGSCAGNTIGLFTDKMSKADANKAYGGMSSLEYKDRVTDSYRRSWEKGDWTSDTDQMILIMDMILQNSGRVDSKVYAQMLRRWSQKGFAELGDSGSAPMGGTTCSVINHKDFLTNPFKAAVEVWEKKDRNLAANGAVMRTCILGVHCYGSLQQVTTNTVEICKVTHADPKCQASCVAVTTAIALMLQQQQPYYSRGTYNIQEIIHRCYEEAKKTLSQPKDQQEMKDMLWTTQLSELKLDEAHRQGYTYKCMGVGFWALRQTDFRTAIETIIKEGGDADTNGVVAGALLGCKLGYSNIPTSWRSKFRHQQWLDDRVERFLELVEEM